MSNRNKYHWLYSVCMSVKTSDQSTSASKLIQIAKNNEHITVEQHYDLYMVLYEKIICGAV